MEALCFIQNDTPVDSFEQSVIIKKASLPANQIVTKEYVLDVKPIIKFILRGDMQKAQENIAYIPPRVKNVEYDRYGQQFHPTDFLGYKYAEQFDRMVYFRYNNQQFNELHDNSSSKGTKYFAGLYIPLQALQSNQFKAQDNIYNALNLSAPQIKDSIAQSFAKNSRGCSFDPLFSSNFTSGNMMAAIRKKPFQYDIILQQDTNCKAAEWFNFAVKFIQEGTYTFNIVNLSNQNPLYGKGMKIPYFSFLEQSTKPQTAETLQSGHGWTFGGTNIKFLKTDTRKQKQSIEQTYFCLSFDYKCKKRQQIVVFASSIPYTSLDYERFLNRVLFGKVGQHMKMQKIQIGQTLAGSPLSVYVFYHRKSKTKTLLLQSISQEKILQSTRPSERRRTINLSSQNSTTFLPSISQNSSVTKSIVFLARQNSGQTSSSFVLEGVINFLMDNTEFDVSKKNFQFVIIPFVNPDGVKYGNQRVNLAGSDLDKSWTYPNEVFEPEVYQVKKWLKNMNQIHPISLLINLSSNNHTLSSYFKCDNNRKYCEQVPQLLPYLISKRVSQVSFQKLQIGSLQKHSLVSSLSEVFPKALVYDFTTSSFGWNAQNSLQKKITQPKIDKNEQMLINEFTPEIYRGMGKELISTYLEYVRLCQRNIGVQDRWIKEIKELAHNLHFMGKQNNSEEKKYELGWEQDLILLDYPLLNPLKPQAQKKQGKKHKTFLQYRFIGGGNMSQVKKSRQKKLTMPFLKSISSLKEQKENSSITSMVTSSNPIDTSNTNLQMDSLFSQQKEKTEIMLRQKDKLQIADKVQFKGHKDNVTDGFLKFQSIKRSIPALGIRTESKRA